MQRSRKGYINANGVKYNNFLTLLTQGSGVPSFRGGWVTAHGYTQVSKIFSSVIPPLLPLIFNYFQQCMFKTALAKTALDEGLL
jgi:hypothetical protein